MAEIAFTLDSSPRALGVFTIVRSTTGQSIMDLRNLVSDGKPIIKWDTDDFPLDSDRVEHYNRIRDSITKLASCDCGYRLFYRPSSDDNPELVSIAQLNNLLESEIEYEAQDRD